ncbi:hypothetical protein BDQ17DRAFT_109354 [Cyathus striatus]|nr:hypothetical protein BDQ17DRAFT_109354 [Cyathus striatus]
MGSLVGRKGVILALLRVIMDSSSSRGCLVSMKGHYASIMLARIKTYVTVLQHCPLSSRTVERSSPLSVAVVSIPCFSQHYIGPGVGTRLLHVASARCSLLGSRF